MMGRKVYSRCPIRLNFAHPEDLYVDASNGQFTELQDGDEIIAPPLSMVDCREVGRRIIDAMFPLSNGHRRMTVEDWVRLDEAIRRVLDKAGSKFEFQFSRFEKE